MESGSGVPGNSAARRFRPAAALVALVLLPELFRAGGDDWLR